MADHPSWLLRLISAVEDYEDSHESFAKVEDPGPFCLGKALADVPDAARQQARGYAQARRETRQESTGAE